MKSPVISCSIFFIKIIWGRRLGRGGPHTRNLIRTPLIALAPAPIRTVYVGRDWRCPKVVYLHVFQNFLIVCNCDLRDTVLSLSGGWCFGSRVQMHPVFKTLFRRVSKYNKNCKKYSRMELNILYVHEIVLRKTDILWSAENSNFGTKIRLFTCLFFVIFTKVT